MTIFYVKCHVHGSAKGSDNDTVAQINVHQLRIFHCNTDVNTTGFRTSFPVTPEWHRSPRNLCSRVFLWPCACPAANQWCQSTEGTTTLLQPFYGHHTEQPEFRQAPPVKNWRI